MNEIKQQIALAELAGWTKIYRGTKKGKPDDEGNYLWGHDPINDSATGGWTECSWLPNFLKDRNASILVFSKLTTTQQWLLLEKLLEPQPVTFWQVTAIFLLALRPEVLCEYILRTVGKWEDEE